MYGKMIKPVNVRYLVRAFLDVWTFKFSSDDPWQIETDELADFNDPVRPRLVKLLNSFMFLLRIKLVKLSGGRVADDEMEYKDQIILVDAMRKSDKSPRLLLRQLMALSLLLYLVLDLGTTMVLLHQHDSSIPKLRSEAIRLQRLLGGNLTQSDCINSNLLSKQYQTSLNETIRISKILDARGQTIRSRLGVEFFTRSIFGPLSLYSFLLISHQLFAKDCVRSYGLAMLMFPKKAQELVQTHLDQVLVSLRRCHLNSQAKAEKLRPHQGREFALSRECACREDAILALDNEDNHAIWCPSCLTANLEAETRLAPPRQTQNTEPKHRTQRRQTLPKILDEIHNKRLARPFFLSTNWQRSITGSVYLNLLACLAVAALFVTAYIVLPCSIESCSYFDQHLSELKCKRQADGLNEKNQTILSLASRIFAIQPLSRDDEALYEPLLSSSILPTWSERTYFGMFVELKYLFHNTAAYLLALKVTLPYAITCLWSTFWYIVFSIDFVVNIGSLLQIRAQLSSLRRHLNSNELKQKPTPQTEGNSNGGLVNKMDLSQLELKLTIIYINYQLFRKRYSPYHEIKQLILGQVLGLTIWCMALLYFVASTLETTNLALVITSSGLVIFYLNLVLLMASYVLRLISRIMRDLLIIHANMVEVLPERSIAELPILDLWRRQLLSEHEINLFTATQFISISVTHRRLVTVNVHLIGLWLLLWKFQARFK